MDKTSTHKPMIFLLISWLLALISLYLQSIWGSSLFSRSGSLMVLFAVIAEYNLLNQRDKYHSEKLKKYSSGEQVNFMEIHPKKGHQYLETAAHITIITGTIIWGYGDLLFLAEF